MEKELLGGNCSKILSKNDGKFEVEIIVEKLFKNKM